MRYSRPQPESVGDDYKAVFARHDPRFLWLSKRRLIDEIDELRERVATGRAPLGVQPDTVDAIDDVRKIGNTGAHMEADINVIVDVDVLADGTVVGRIMKVPAAPVGSPWMWTLAFGQHEDRTRQHTATRSRHSTIAGGASAASAIMNASIASRWHRARIPVGNGRNRCNVCQRYLGSH